MWIKDLCLKHNVHFLGIQESKMTRLELFRIKSMWGNYAFDYACSMARGLSGDLISIWDPNMFSKNSIWCDDSFIIIKGNWKNVVGDCFMVNIYGPQDHVSKLALWNRLTDFMHHHNGSYIMFGDMNAVRNAQERFGTTLNSIEADHFNSFIDSTGLVDLPIGGRSFTWMNKAGTKLSKLDRFLISEDVTIRLPDVRITALDRLWSDHNPILLHIDKTDFGPTPFKLYNSWLLRDGFDNLIKEEWELLDSNLKCHEKFRRLKDKIKQWSNNIKTLERNRKTVALEEINSIEKRIDEGSAMPSDNDHRLILLQEIEKIDKFASMDIIQKAHVKWDIEGDENSKFFHGLINQKRRNQMINGIMVEGNWITNPCLIKDAFLQFYKRKFQAQDSQVMFSNLPHSHSLNCMDRETLERQVTLEEIKEAVWDCGSSKAPGPDGYSFAFVKKYWGTIQKDLYDFVNLFFASCVMPNGANSSFFTLIPKVNNPTLITDFRPISLIGIHYKIIAKILANRLSKVIDKIVSKEQSAFIAGRQILDGPRAPESVLQDLERIRAKFFWGGNKDENKMAWVKWPIILNSFDKGGLNIGSLKAFNLALLKNGVEVVALRIRFWKDIWVVRTPLFTRIGPIILPTLAHKLLLWDKLYTLEVNVFYVEASLDRLPQKDESLSAIVGYPAISCPSCNANVESANHVFSNATLLPICGSSFLDGVIFLLSRLLMGFYQYMDHLLACF
ncbi:RNA-directed DNA polymerase, eukaryota, reverse transcriptase zinc-binding domain protein [Tanacetum coccineum]